MAGYSAVIDLRVNGLDALRTVSDRVESVQKLLKGIKPVPSIFAGTATQEVKEVAKELDNLVKRYADGSVRAATFSSSIAGLNAQLNTFRTVAVNASTTSQQFTNALKAAENASNKLVAAELERLSVLNSIYTREEAQSAKGPSGMTKNVLDLGKQLPGNIAGLRAYAAELDRVFSLVEAGSVDYRRLQQEIARVNKEIDVATGQGGMQGPALPPKPGKPAPGTLRFRRGMSTNELEDLSRNWNELFNTLPVQSKDFISLDRTLRQLDVVMGRGGQLGPALPPGFTTKGLTAATERARQQAISDAGAGRQGPLLPPAVGGGFDLPPSMGRLAPPRFQGLQAMMAKPGMADAVIGGAFPFLFGGGPGAALGGFGGGLVGGAMGGTMGMALSLGASAIGQKFDQIFGEAIRATQELGKALSALDAKGLRETSLLVTAEFENQNRLLLEAGQYEQARAMATKQVAAQTGALGSSTADAANAANLLKNSFDNMMSPVNSLLANLSAPFAAALAGILNIVGLIAKGLNVIVSGVGQLLKGITEWGIKLVGGQKALDRVRELTTAASEQTEELRAAAEAEIDAGVRNVQLKKQLLGIESQRLEGTNRIARASQIEADFRSKAAQIQADKENEIRQIYAEGSKLTEQQRNLKIQIAETTAEQKLQEAGITAEKARQKLLNDEAIAKLEMAKNLQEAQARNNQVLLSSESQRLQIAIQRLQQEQQFSMSLNQQTGYINHIANLRKDQAQAEYQANVAASQAAVQQAAKELAVTELKYKQNEANTEQLQKAQLNLQNAQIQARVETEIAGLKLEQLNYTTDVERAQAVVNAYAEDYARINAETTRKIEEQTNAINNRATLLNAISQATQTLNNIEIQGLERELERTTNAGKRKAIIEEIYKLEVENARVQLEATRANIQAELARADAAYRTVQLKYEELRAVVKIAEAQGVVTRAHYEALRAQESALRIAADNLDVANKVANLQWKAADAVYEAAVDAAELKKEMAGTAEAAGTFAGNMERAVGAISGVSGALGSTTQGAPFAAFGGAMGIEDPELRKQAMAIWDAATKFAEGKDYKVMQDIFQKARDDIAALIARGGAPEKRTVNIKDLQDEIDKVYEEMRSGEYMTQKSHLEDIEERRKAFLESINLGEGGKQMQELQTEQDEKYKKLLESATGATESVDGATEAITTMAAAFETMRESILAFAEPTATDTKSNPAPGSIPLTAPLASGLSMQPGGGPGTAIIDTMPTINLQTGPVLQQENGEKYVRLGDLETILQDFAATVFNNARSTGGRRFQGVN